MESLEQIVDALCALPSGAAPKAGRWLRHGPSPSGRPLPSRDKVVAIVEMLRSAIFPGYFGEAQVLPEALRFHVGAALDRAGRELREQVACALCYGCEMESGTCDPSRCDARAADKVRSFLARLPEVRRLLATDVRAAYEGDPAAKSPDETIICYPGMFAIMNYRIAHELHALEVPLLPRMITEHAHSVTGIDIHPGAAIGESFFIDHGTGVVIGETTVIGSRVRLYQGVTLGAKSFPLDEHGNPIKDVPRHPIVEDDVVIYSEATILGRVTIGKGSHIGGNVSLTRSVPPDSWIGQTAAKHGRSEDAL